MDKKKTNIVPLVIFIILFFLISILIFKYLGISFKNNDEQVLRRIITVETFNNKKDSLPYNNLIG